MTLDAGPIDGSADQFFGLSIGLGLGLVDRTRGMGRRGVDGDEAHRAIASIEDVVAGAGVDEDEIVRRRPPPTGDVDQTLRRRLQLDEQEDLVRVGMDLVADLATRRDRHDDDLFAGAGLDHAAKGVVLSAPRQGRRPCSPRLDSLRCSHGVLQCSSDMPREMPKASPSTLAPR